MLFAFTESRLLVWLYFISFYTFMRTLFALTCKSYSSQDDCELYPRVSQADCCLGVTKVVAIATWYTVVMGTALVARLVVRVTIFIKWRHIFMVVGLFSEIRFYGFISWIVNLYSRQIESSRVEHHIYFQNDIYYYLRKYKILLSRSIYATSDIKPRMNSTNPLYLYRWNHPILLCSTLLCVYYWGVHNHVLLLSYVIEGISSVMTEGVHFVGFHSDGSRPGLLAVFDCKCVRGCEPCCLVF